MKYIQGDECVISILNTVLSCHMSKLTGLVHLNTGSVLYT